MFSHQTTTAVIALFLLITIQNICACCIPSYMVSVDTLCLCEENTTVQINVTSFTGDTISTIKSQKQLLTHLASTYDSSNTCAVGIIQGVTEHWEPFDSSGVSLFVNEISVSVTEIIKGSVQQHCAVIIDTIQGKRRLRAENADGTGFDTLAQIMSIIDPGYSHLVGKPYIIFSALSSLDSLHMLPPRPSPCGQYQRGYYLTNTDDIVTHATNADFNTGVVESYLGLSVSLENFRDEIDNGTAITHDSTKKPHASVTLTDNITVFNLQGVRLFTGRYNTMPALIDRKLSRGLLLMKQGKRIIKKDFF